MQTFIETCKHRAEPGLGRESLEKCSGDNMELGPLYDMTGLIFHNLICEEKNFKLNSGFNTEPMKRS